MGSIQLGPKTYYLKEGEAIVSFTSSTLADDVEKGKTQSIAPPGGGEAINIMTWGKDNNLPQVMEDLVSNNVIVPALMATKRNILMGNGLMAYKVRYEPQPDGSNKKVQEEVEMPEEVQNWLDGEGWENGSNFYEYMAAAAGELVKHSLVIPEFVRNKGGDIMSVEVKECKYMRAGMKGDNGKISTWYWSGHWGRKQAQTKEKKKTVAIPVYTGEDAKQPKFILPLGDFMFNDGYYPLPTWRGSKDWIEMSNFIAPFHKSNIKNGYNMRWHVEIASDYFLDYVAWEACAGDTTSQQVVLDTAAKAEQKFMDDINGFLAGIANAGRTVWTKFEIDKAAAKEFPGVKIHALDYDMKDEAMLRLFDKSITAATVGQGVHPTLAAVETAGKLSSGTEMRNALLMWLLINTMLPRASMLRPLDIKKKTANWDPKMFFAVRDYELTALSANPAGMQQRETPVQQ